VKRGVGSWGGGVACLLPTMFRINKTSTTQFTVTVSRARLWFRCPMAQLQSGGGGSVTVTVIHTVTLWRDEFPPAFATAALQL
jgi:hypothetical protein